MKQISPICDAPHHFVAPFPGTLVAKVFTIQTCRADENISLGKPAKEA